MEAWAGFLIGFFGSLHCIGMCGPIALALPSSTVSGWSFINGRVIYNFGRVFTYALLGLSFGLLGSSLYMFGFQQIVSISIGVIIMLWLIIPSGIKNKVRNITGFNYFTVKFKSLFLPLFKKKSIGSMFFIGVLNGILPCGFVYMAIAGALAVSSANPLNSMMFMILFGLGTVPAMLGTSIAGNFVNFNFKRKFAKLVPVFAVFLAVIFILRGLNLGIPFISPRFDMKHEAASKQILCH
jgi:sulfite exporter TauE/SafE